MYLYACGTKAETPNTEHRTQPKSRSTTQPVLLVSHNGDTPLENIRHVSSLFLVISRICWLCKESRVGHKPKMKPHRKKIISRKITRFFFLIDNRAKTVSSDFLKNCCYCCCLKWQNPSSIIYNREKYYNRVFKWGENHFLMSLPLTLLLKSTATDSLVKLVLKWSLSPFPA